MSALPLPVPLGLSGHLKSRLFVTGRVTKSLALRLQEAEILMLVSAPRTAAAEGLVAELSAAVEAGEARLRPRGAGRRKDLAEAVGAIVGDVLKPALRRDTMVSRSRSEGAYNGYIGYSAALAALDGLIGLGFLNHHPGVRFDASPYLGKSEWGGLVSRYEATGALLGLAASYGVTASTVKEGFGTRFPPRAEVVKKPVELRRLKEAGGTAIPISRNDPVHSKIAAEVRLANRLLTVCSWSSNCQPPALRRAFRYDWTLGGRWIVAGAAPIQQMAPEDRLDILMDGAPVCEVDVRGSQLSIVAALAGASELLEDPYQIGGLAIYDREIVKAAATVTLGTGRLRRTWPANKDYSVAVSMAEITAALVSAHPYIRDLAGLLDVSAGQVALRLQNIEAECLTAAMRPLWTAGIPSVPLHDGLLVPASAAERTDIALREGYLSVAGAVIQTKRSTRVT